MFPLNDERNSISPRIVLKQVNC